jgi:hypothetical protein
MDDTRVRKLACFMQQEEDEILPFQEKDGTLMADEQDLLRYRLKTSLAENFAFSQNHYPF